MATMSSERMSAFSRDFAAAIRGVMKEHGVRQHDLVTYLGKSGGYVSGRISGKNPIDTDIIDAVGELAGLDTVALMAEITRRLASAGDPSARRRQAAAERYAAGYASADDSDTPTDLGSSESA